MTRTIVGFAAGLALAATLPALPAQAQLARSFVSAQSGLDTNPCTRTAPCRSFAFAITQTNAGGEINTLDPGGYGALTITKSISIVSGLGEAGVLVPPGGTGITINANSTDIINLRGLVIEGEHLGVTGIVFNGGGFLTMQGCVVRNLTASGIAFAPTVVGVNSVVQFDVSDSIIANNGGHGIYVQPSGAGTVKATFDRVHAINNSQDGIGIYGNLKTIGNFPTPDLQAVVNDSTSSGNGVGFHAFTISGKAPAGLTVSHSVAANSSDTGILADGPNATLRIGQSTVVGNQTGWFGTNSGQILSYADNYIDINQSNTDAPPAIPRK